MLKLLVKKQLAEIFRSYLLRRQEEPEARSKEPSFCISRLFVVLMVGVLGGMFTCRRHDAVRRVWRRWGWTGCISP